jgi:hypothetical protein
MHPELGIPLLASDQLNVIGQHLHEMKHGPAQGFYLDGIDFKIMTGNNPDNISSGLGQNLPFCFSSVFQPRIGLSRVQLQAREDWSAWKAAEWKQLHLYETQKMFSDPIQPPKEKYNGHHML